jgi:hypothetical protein
VVDLYSVAQWARVDDVMRQVRARGARAQLLEHHLVVVGDDDDVGLDGIVDELRGLVHADPVAAMRA